MSSSRKKLPDTIITAAPKSRTPELERNVTVTTNCHSKSSPRHCADARKKDDSTRSGCKHSREDSGERANSRDLFGSRGMSASHLSKIIFPGAKFPSAKDMLQKDAYVDMAQYCMKFLASANRLTIKYEDTALSQGHKHTKAVKLKRAVEARVAALEANVKETEKKRRETGNMLSESESEKKCLKQEVSDLTVRLNDASKLRDVAVQRDVDKAKSKLVAEYEAKLDRAREKLKVLNDQPRINIIEFVKLLQSDKAPDLCEELSALKEQEADLSFSDEEFAEHVRELEEILGSLKSNKRTLNEHASIREVIHLILSSSSSVLK